VSNSFREYWAALEDGSIDFPERTVPPLTPAEWKRGAPPPRTRERPAVRRRTVTLPFTAVEEAQLRRLVYQAFDLRGTPYLIDACEAVIDWSERTLPDRLERHARRRQA
jgi:hypothetical protein